jgi:hypothetical protein
MTKNAFASGIVKAKLDQILGTAAALLQSA